MLTWPVPNRSRSTLLPLIEEHTAPGSLYYTDEYQAYASLSLRGGHVVVSKKEGRPRGREHINGIEGFWSYAKHWLYTDRGVPQHHFPLYLKEIECRFNHRDEDLLALFAEILTNPVSDVTSSPSPRTTHRRSSRCSFGAPRHGAAPASHYLPARIEADT